VGSNRNKHACADYVNAGHCGVSVSNLYAFSHWGEDDIRCCWVLVRSQQL